MDKNKKWNSAAEILAAGASISKDALWNINGHHLALIPKGYKVEDLEAVQPHPVRKKGKIHVDALDDFFAAVERYCNDKDNALVTFDEDNMTISAVLNYGDASKPGWSDFEVVYRATREKEWDIWAKNDQVRMGILEMTDFLDEHVLDVVEPTSGEMIDMISNLRVRKNASFQSVVDQTTGNQTIRFEETIKGETVKGDIETVSIFKIAIAPFVGSGKYSIDCRFRLSIDGNNKLRVYYQMVNADLCLRDAVRTMYEATRERLQGFVILRGSVGL